jgi:hypothetical protein
MSGLVFVFAFDPIEELEGREGVLLVRPELAESLIARHHAEDLEAHGKESMRFVAGSPAHAAARDALRAARAAAPAANAPSGPRKARAPAKRGI